MGYNNNNNNNNNSNYNGSNGYNNNNNNQPQSKKSGVVYTVIKQGKFAELMIVNAWNKSKSRGLIVATVAPYYASGDKVESKTGNSYMKMMCTVEYKSSGHQKLFPCLMNIATKVIVLKELGMVITPNGSGKTSSGKKVTGYFGTMTK